MDSWFQVIHGGVFATKFDPADHDDVQFAFFGGGSADYSGYVILESASADDACIKLEREDCCDTCSLCSEHWEIT